MNSAGKSKSYTRLPSKEFALTKDFMDECFEYRDGSLIWKARPESHFHTSFAHSGFITRTAGKAAGTMSGGYLMIKIGPNSISAHRAVFLMAHGYLPEEVDHIDGNPLNNRIENLRGAVHAENLKNRKTPSNNTSGAKGVCFHIRSRKWTAQIRDRGVIMHLGSFNDFDSALKVRKKAEHKFYGEFASDR